MFQARKPIKRFLKRIRNAIHRLSTIRLRGLNLYLNSPDRTLLEDVIIQHFAARQDIQRVLFVGCDWYTKPYQNLFKTKEYWTIEIDPDKKKYGSSNHIIDRLENLSQHVKAGYFDLIVYNCVVGWGTDNKEAIEESLKQVYRALCPEGILVFGWNDVPKHWPFQSLEECKSLRQFEPYSFEPLGTSQYLTPEIPLRHTFNFYKRPAQNS